MPLGVAASGGSNPPKTATLSRPIPSTRPSLPPPAHKIVAVRKTIVRLQHDDCQFFIGSSTNIKYNNRRRKRMFGLRPGLALREICHASDA